MKLENKLVFILLVMGVLSAAVVGGVAYYMLLKDFNQRFKDEAYGNFGKDIEMYIQEYGGWENAINSEEFHSFTQRMVASGKKTPPPHAQNAIQREKIPPMRFLVLSKDGKILRGTESIQTGSKASEEMLQKAEPIYLDGDVEVFISPVGELILSESDRSYLSAMRDSLLYGFFIAALFAVAIGLIVGKRIGRSIRSIIVAIKEMSQDHTKTIKIDSERKDEIGELANAFNTMNSELSLAYKKLKELSIKDPLTKLYNRRHFDEQAGTLFKEAKRYDRALSVMIGDIDFFKKINDNFSHAIGDEVLKRVAEILTKRSRESDIVARYGGEEFVMVMPNTELDEAYTHCQRLRSAIETYAWEDISEGLKVTMSMGINSDTTQKDVEHMIQSADERLYEAKHSGRNMVLPKPSAS